MHRGSQRRHTARRFLVSAACAGSLVAAGALGVGVAGAAGPTAHAARTISLKETGNLRYSNKQGSVVKEQGYASGTLSGPIYLQLRLTSTKSVSATVQVYPKGGLLRGSASASYRNHGSYATFSGRMNISSGSGTYRKAHASGLSFSGKINRSNSAVVVYVSGQLSY
jgi:hypothetical protein